MIVRKLICDRCKQEIDTVTIDKRELWLIGDTRGGGLDLCLDCYHDLYSWFNDPETKITER